MAKLTRRGALVRVTWLDAEHMDGWQDVAATQGRLKPCTTTGYVVAHRKDRLTIASSFHGPPRSPDEVLSPLTIPAAVIRRVVVLTP